MLPTFSPACHFLKLIHRETHQSCYSAGIWGVGLATRNADLNLAPGGHDKESWVLCHNGSVRNNRTELLKVPENAQEGDVLVRIILLISIYSPYHQIIFRCLSTIYSRLHDQISRYKLIYICQSVTCAS